MFFFNDTATNEIYTLSLPDALPISLLDAAREAGARQVVAVVADGGDGSSVRLHGVFGFVEAGRLRAVGFKHGRSEEHTSELQSRNLSDAVFFFKKKNKLNIFLYAYY